MKKLEQLKSEVREKFTYHVTQEDAPVFTPDMLDTLIETAYNAGIERAVEVVNVKMVEAHKKSLDTDYDSGFFWGLKEAQQVLLSESNQLQAEVNKDNK